MASQTTISHATAPHGVKRRSDDNDGPQRLAKRFHLLRLDQNGTAVASNARDQTLFTSPPKQHSNTDCMQVDDSKDKIYIYNLEDELAEVSKENDSEEKLIFLPDIERHLNGLSKRKMLGGEQNHEPQGNELVVYGVPTSLTVPEEKDSVRRAILESRARARQKQDEEMLSSDPHEMDHDGRRDWQAHDTTAGYNRYDGDAMDTG